MTSEYREAQAKLEKVSAVVSDTMSSTMSPVLKTLDKVAANIEKISKAVWQKKYIKD
jgi:hypothetical protein